jgi:hypothetical protein
MNNELTEYEELGQATTQDKIQVLNLNLIMWGRVINHDTRACKLVLTNSREGKLGDHTTPECAPLNWLSKNDESM